MKKYPLLALLALATTLSITSCKKKTTETPTPTPPESSINAEEEKAISLTTLNTGVTIAGAAKVAGLPPAPKGNVNFNIEASEIEGLQSSGFTIPFTSTSSFAGAYVLIQDLDGNVAPEYFDIPVEAIQTLSNESNDIKTPHSKTKTNRNLKRDNHFSAISVAFNSTVPVGRFCFEICIYDYENNVSAIKKVCVEVEAWGGNSAIVGEWIHDRSEPSNSEGNQTFYCDNGDSLFIPYSNYEYNDWEFVLEANGNYHEIYNSKSFQLDYMATQQSCTAIYSSEPFIDNVRYDGKWAYNEENKTVSVIDFSFTNNVDPAGSETYPNGSLYINQATMQIINGELVISENSVDEDGVVYTAFFKRK